MEKITLNHLRLMARECGLKYRAIAVHSSLTKSNLINNIRQSCLPESVIRTKLNPIPQFAERNKESHLADDEKFRIFSIDMGIRNLAICQMTVSKSDPFGQKPIIEKWTKLNMEDYLNKDISANQLELDTLESPIGMTKIAYDFAQSYIFDNYKFGTKLTSSKSKKLIKGRKNIEILKARIPDIVLIERQRDRSMPNTATPGWTAKVNRLEGMIYSTIYTISQQHNLDILLEPILPAKVAKYWIRGLDEECTTNLCTEDAKNIRAKLTKTTKTQRTILAADLFDQCIDQNPSAQFVLSDRADDQALLSQIFFNANKAKRADRRKTALNTKLNNKDSKEDDLADSMLQALTWLRWQQAREIYGGIIHNHSSLLVEDVKQQILDINADLQERHASLFAK